MKSITPAPCFLQSESWGVLQRAIHKTVFTFDVDGFGVLAIKTELPFGFSYLYIPHGPHSLILHDERMFRIFVAKIMEVAKDTNSIFIKIDPRTVDNGTYRNMFSAHGFQRAPEMQPERTIMLDITKARDELLHAMDSETRYAIRTAEKRGVTIKTFTSCEEKEKYFETFWQMFVRTMARSELISHPRDYFEELFTFDDEPRADLYIAEVDGRPISSGIFLKYRQEYVYLYAASEKGFGRYNAPSLILFHAIEEAKKEGLATLDLWGISYAKKKWAGITKFKKGFGGEEILYVGAWDLPVRPLWYKVYGLTKKFR